jgi:hypothetical protein
MANALASPTDGSSRAGLGDSALRAPAGPASPAPRQRIPSSEELRRAALARSVRRGTRVARWRVALRWSLWGLGQLLMALGMLMLAGTALATLGLGWWQFDATRGPALLPPAAAVSARPPPAAAVPSVTPAPVLPLRLDDSELAPARKPPSGNRAAAQSPNNHTASTPP